VRRLHVVHDALDLGRLPNYPGPMYAIAFDLDLNLLKEHYPGNTPTQGYGDIRKFLETKGFGHQQGSVYFGEESVDAVHTVVTVQQMAATYPWLSHCVKDIRMLRIEENNDLSIAIPAPAPAAEPPSLFGQAGEAA
jgi:virulence-associated protein VapD